MLGLCLGVTESCSESGFNLMLLLPVCHGQRACTGSAAELVYTSIKIDSESELNLNSQQTPTNVIYSVV